MKIALIGSEGYLGRALYRKLVIRHDVYRHDIFVYNQRDFVEGDPILAEETAFKIARWIDDFEIDVVIWLAAYAHDPERFITYPEMVMNNAYLPRAVYERTTCRFIFLSSLSVYSTSPYALSKRQLEQIFTKEDAPRRARFLRFGTLYGVDGLMQDPESFRSHLVLNSMCYDALVEGKIFVRGANLHRPVLPVHTAASLVAKTACEPGPAGTIHNHYQTCGTLGQFAKVVQGVAKDLDHPCTIHETDMTDTRDYGWGSFDPDCLRPQLFLTMRWLEKNQASVAKYRAEFPQNLYDFVEKRRR